MQLVRATKANALHRAGIEKLMLHQKVRQQGIAHQLLTLAEDKAKHSYLIRVQAMSLKSYMKNLTL